MSLRLCFSTIGAVLFFLTCDALALSGNIKPGRLKNKKVVIVNSYHKGYEWSDAVVDKASDILKHYKIIVRVITMDTKRNSGENFIKQAALKAKKTIEKFNPNVIIACDDNASQYLIKPYFKDSKYPVVFVGVNWDAGVYGYPYKNSTGMIEVEMIEKLYAFLRKYAKGSRVGFLSSGDKTSRKVAKTYNRLFFNGKLKVLLTDDFKQFKNDFLKFQNDVDILIIYTNGGIKNWDRTGFEKFAIDNTLIPTGSAQDWMAPYVLATFAKNPEEFGSFAADSAMQILSGMEPQEIPVQVNQKTRLTVNTLIGDRLKIVFPLSIIKTAKIYPPGISPKSKKGLLK